MSILDEKQELLNEKYGLLFELSRQRCKYYPDITVGEYRKAVEHRLEQLKPSLEEELRKIITLKCPHCVEGKHCMGCNNSKLNLDGRVIVEDEDHRDYAKHVKNIFSSTH